MKVAVTGAASKLGVKLVRRLLEEKIDIIALAHQNKIEVPVLQRPVDIMDQTSLDNALRGVDLVVHLAALTHSRNTDDYFQINTEGAKKVILACQNNSVKRLIFVSTRAIGRQAGGYGYSKFLAEEEIRKSSLDWVIIRPSEIYGLGGLEGIDKLINSAKNDFLIPVLGDDKASLNPVYCQDVVDFIAQAAIRPAAGRIIYTLAGPRDYSYQQLVKTIVKIYRRKCLLIPLPISWLKILSFLKLFIYPDQVARVLVAKSSDISLAASDYGYNPINIEDYLMPNESN